MFMSQRTGRRKRLSCLSSYRRSLGERTVLLISLTLFALEQLGRKTFNAERSMRLQSRDRGRVEISTVVRSDSNLFKYMLTNGTQT